MNPTQADRQKFAAHRLLAITYSDASAYKPPHADVPRGYNHEQHYHLALSYVYKVKGRLPAKLYDRFYSILHAHGTTIMIDRTREEVSLVFELANEYELWEEFLDAFMPCWLMRQEAREQRRIAWEVEVQKVRAMGGRGRF
ncbi:MAG: hypothetical protein Q9219_007526 [cf. Caloplaca sp. 3 TL-2023]